MSNNKSCIDCLHFKECQKHLTSLCPCADFKTKKQPEQKIEIDVIAGREGLALCVNGYRVLGNKPCGGGIVKQT